MLTTIWLWTLQEEEAARISQPRVTGQIACRLRYCFTVNVKSPSVRCVSTDTTCHVTRYAHRVQTELTLGANREFVEIVDSGSSGRQPWRD